MDGRFHGRPIVQAGAPVQTFGSAGYFPQGGFGGIQTFGAPMGFGGASAAARLDAADGVMDGRFHGRPIIQAGAPQGYFPQGGFGGASAAQRLDAADGVMDGRHFGRPIVRV
jgi:hypothetical protein